MNDASSASFSPDTHPDFFQHTTLTEEVSILLYAADLLSKAKTEDEVTEALDYNLKLWVYFKSCIDNQRSLLPAHLNDNIRALADYVIGTTFAAGERALTGEEFSTLVRTDYELARGLNAVQRQSLISERAYHIWESNGRPQGRDSEHWLQAEQEIDTVLTIP